MLLKIIKFFLINEIKKPIKKHNLYVDEFSKGYKSALREVLRFVDDLEYIDKNIRE